MSSNESISELSKAGAEALGSHTSEVFGSHTSKENGEAI